jgi:hypothetical protein
LKGREAAAKVGISDHAAATPQGATRSIIAYTACVYWIFRGKVRAEVLYDKIPCGVGWSAATPGEARASAREGHRKRRVEQDAPGIAAGHRGARLGMPGAAFRIGLYVARLGVREGILQRDVASDRQRHPDPPLCTFQQCYLSASARARAIRTAIGKTVNKVYV